MITLTKHFISETFIENLEGCVSQTPSLLLVIQQYEAEALKMALGECLFNEFKGQFEWNAEQGKYVLKSEVDEKWEWLLNGRTYEYDGYRAYGCGCGCSSSNCKEIRYSGILETFNISPDATFEKNYLSYYIYYSWKTINETVTAGTGEQMPQVENSLRVYNKKKRYNAWNRWVDWIESVHDFLRHHNEEFPDAQTACNLRRLNIYDV